MNYCPNCKAGLTSTDYEAGFCTQCKSDLIDDGADDDDLWNDAALQAEHELRREELSK